MIDLLGGIAQDYGLSGDQIGWVNGLARGLFTASGALLLIFIPKKTDTRVTYSLIGLANALAVGISASDHQRKKPMSGA